MEEIKIIKTTELLGKQLTVYGTPDEPLFRAKDVADMIEHPNITKMLSDNQIKTELVDIF